MKRIVIISTSLRKNSNSDALAREFARGAAAAGHSVELISLIGKNLAFCQGCLACQSTGRCVISDDAIPMAEAMKSAQVLVFATPVYYYEMSGQMKTLLDRCNSLYDSDYAFGDVYLLATAAEGEDSAIEGTTHGLQGWIDCFPRATLAGVLKGTGLTDPGEAQKAAHHLARAYEMGQSV